MPVSRATYQARIAAGLCGKCGSPAASGRSRCADCLAKARDISLRRYRDHKEAGICVVCSDPAATGLRVCGRHARDLPQYAREWRAHQASEGLCARCVESAVEGHKLCARHIEADRAEGRMEYPTKIQRDLARRATYRSEGKCVRCGAIPAPGKSRCGEHLTVARVEQLLLRRRRGQKSRRSVRCPSCKGRWMMQIRSLQVARCQLCRGRGRVSQRLAGLYVRALHQMVPCVHIKEEVETHGVGWSRPPRED